MDPPRIPKGHAVRPLVLYGRSEVERFRTELAERRASRGVGIPVNQKKPIERNRTFEYTNRNNRGVDHLRNDDPGSSLYMRRENQRGEVRILVLDLYEREGWK